MNSSQTRYDDTHPLILGMLGSLVDILVLHLYM
jgi:hypothetical protein